MRFTRLCSSKMTALASATLSRFGRAALTRQAACSYAASGQAGVESASHGCPGAYHFPSHVGAYGYDTTLAAMSWDIPSCPGDSFGSVSC